MKRIQIIEITLKNFKGIRSLTIPFHKETNIYGDNGTGKTTIFDAFTWLFFGKDSGNRKDFEVKTLDKDNIVIPKIEHEVAAVIEVNGESISIRRILKENWVKKRGSLEPEFSGNVTDYYWNDVPLQQKAYQDKISNILDESVFKMITNPLAFNALKWQDRREALIKIVGDVSNEEIANGDTNYEKLISQLRNGKSLEDYRKQIHASVKKAKEDLKAIPTRIDEISKSMPESYDFVQLEAILNAKLVEITAVDGQIANKSSAFDAKLTEINRKKLAANTIKNEIASIEFEAGRKAKQDTTPDTSALKKLKSKLQSLSDDLTTATIGMNSLSTKKENLDKQLLKADEDIIHKRKQWEAVNKKNLIFDDNAFCCPTCKRDFEADDIEEKKSEMKANFIKDKQSKLSAISSQGKALSEEKSALQQEHDKLLERLDKGHEHISKIKEDIENLKSDIQTEESNIAPNDDLQEELVYESILSFNPDYKAKKAQLKELEGSIEEVPVVDTTALKNQKAALQSEVDSIKAKLHNKERIKAVNARKNELQEEESRLAQQIVDVEKEQFIIENFNKLKIDMLEAKINSKFRFVKFKMFDTQINGGEVESCEALIDGVPFSDANTASKINAGLDIINTLCDYYQVTAPIFIDNRESVVELIETESQVINLIVWKGSELSVGSPKVDGKEISKTKEQLTIEI